MKHFSVDAYKVKSDPYSIMAEVYMNGPVEVAFTVYEVKEVIKFSLRLRYSFLRHNNSLEIALLFIPNLFRGHLT